MAECHGRPDLAESICTQYASLRMTGRVSSGSICVCRNNDQWHVRDHIHGAQTFLPDDDTKKTEKKKMMMPINTFDKIKVESVTTFFSGANRVHLLEGAHGLRIRKWKRPEQDTVAFLQSNGKIGFPAGTIMRYKLGNRGNSNHGYGISCRSVCRLNVNHSRGLPELFVIMRAYAIRHLLNLKGCRVDPFIDGAPRLNNNCITADGVIACVGNEDTFRERAIKEGLFTAKKEFKTARCVIDLAQEYGLAPSQHDPRELVSVVEATRCGCGRCEKTPHSFHRKSTEVFTTLTKNQGSLVSQALAPLKNSVELQVHDRCLNTSSMIGPQLVGPIANLSCELLRRPDVCDIDPDLVRLTGMMELSTNGLLPAQLSDLCEMIVWKKPPGLDMRQVEKIMQDVQITRRNFSQSGHFCQRTLLGSKLFTTDGRRYISDKMLSMGKMNRKHKNVKRRRRTGPIGHGLR